MRKVNKINSTEFFTQSGNIPWLNIPNLSRSKCFVQVRVPAMSPCPTLVVFHAAADKFHPVEASFLGCGSVKSERLK